MAIEGARFWNAMTDGKWKYIFHAMDGREELFHLDVDPSEERDLAGNSTQRDFACGETV